MSYRKAECVLPAELVEQIQNYIDGECLYIPRKEEHKKSWGESTSIKREMEERNREIYKAYMSGACTAELAEHYYLSPKSIQRIVLQQKKSCA